uniref:Uncharacterized protein n=1 Tax=Daphnia galeata TaxID=27404 RepID=A0A8J2W1D3_9CRUS|nr:unnamed protein product [Daphnia galeata]
MRIQTAQLLHQFIRELTARKLKLSTVMEILTFQSGDEKAPVRNWAWRSARLIVETCAEEALLWFSNRKQEEIEANNSWDLTIYSHIVRGFLHATPSRYTSTSGNDSGDQDNEIVSSEAVVPVATEFQLRLKRYLPSATSLPVPEEKNA